MNRADGLPRLPLGLCGMLVLAAACVLFPRVVDPIAQPARWLMCLPLRALPMRYAEAAQPSERAATRAAATATAMARLADDAVRGGAAVGPNSVPLICRVLDRRVPGAASLPTLLVLDRPWSEVGDCTGLVTRAGCVVGFLGQPSDADTTAARGHAIVRCLHHAPRGAVPRRLIASAVVDGTKMRFVVEPGSRIDAWPLRVGLLEDPYRAARTRSLGQRVLTHGGSVEGVVVPADLELGTLRAWGYVEGGAETLPVGFFVEPAIDPRAIATVVLWRPAVDPQESAPQAGLVASRRSVRGSLLPAGRRLYLVTGSMQVPVGSAVLARDDQFFGTVDESGPGDAIATAFGVVGRAWSLLLVPHDIVRAPIECAAKVVDADDTHVVLQLSAAVEACAGEVLTGGQGLHCPAGLWIGSIEAIEDAGRRLRVHRLAPDLSLLAVLALPESAP